MIIRDIFIGNFPLTQRFGENFQLSNGSWAYGSAGHMGVDFRTPTGTAAVSPTNGTIIRVGNYSDGYGICVQVRDDEQGLIWRMGHFDWTPDIKVGDRVWVGRLVGSTDNTGFSTGAHIHFEIQVGGKYIDPLPYFKCLNITSPVLEDPIVVAQRIAEANERARAEQERLAKAETELLARLAREEAEKYELERQEAERLKAEQEKATKIDDQTTPGTIPPVHAENLDINKRITILDYLKMIIKLIGDLWK
jgi:hypothetical protein